MAIQRSTKKAAECVREWAIRSASRTCVTVVNRANYANPTPVRMQGSHDVSKKNAAQSQSDIEEFLNALPSAEPWLQNNPEAKASVERGLEQAARREVHYLGSFAQFADLEIDD